MLIYLLSKLSNYELTVWTARKIPWTMDLDITQTFFELQTQDFASKFVQTIRKNVHSCKEKSAWKSMQEKFHGPQNQLKLSHFLSYRLKILHGILYRPSVKNGHPCNTKFPWNPCNKTFHGIHATKKFQNFKIFKNFENTKMFKICNFYI